MLRSLAFLVVLSSAEALCESSYARAKQLATEGKKAFDTLDYATAIERYKAAYKLKPAPGLLFNLGQCYRAQGELETAVSFFKRYLESNPPASQAIATQTLLSDVQAQFEEQRRVAAEIAAREEAETAARRASEESERQAQADALRVAAAKAEAEAAQHKLQLELSRREAGPAPVTSRWWFWAGLAAVVAAGASVSVAAGTAPRPAPTTFQDINAR